MNEDHVLRVCLVCNPVVNQEPKDGRYGHLEQATDPARQSEACHPGLDEREAIVLAHGERVEGSRRLRSAQVTTDALAKDDAEVPAPRRRPFFRW